ncbi:MAG: hypothetical protein ACE5FB_09160, partial [Candidatus Binatia bacterium]
VSVTRTANLIAPLQLMADATGGKAIVNTQAIGPALDRMSEDFHTYYSLGYRPPTPGDGRYHSIEVKVKGKGRRVRQGSWPPSSE